MQCSTLSACLNTASIPELLPKVNAEISSGALNSPRAQKFSQFLQPGAVEQSRVGAEQFASSSFNLQSNQSFFEQAATSFRSMLDRGVQFDEQLRNFRVGDASGENLNTAVVDNPAVSQDIADLQNLRAESREFRLLLLDMQKQLIEINMILNALSSAKQGVATLFQQQG